MLEITLKQTRVYREIKEEGREEATVNLVVRLLTKQFGEISEEMRQRISGLPLSVLEDLSEALLILLASPIYRLGWRQELINLVAGKIVMQKFLTVTILL